MPLTEIFYDEGIRKINGIDYYYATKSHSAILTYYMQDAPNLQTKINNIKKPEHNNLIKLAEGYHQAVCLDGEPCIVFEKKQPLTKIAVDVAGGMSFYRYGTPSFTGGVLLNLWLPRTSEKIYFRTGLLYAKFKDTDSLESSTLSSFKIPLMLEYIYPKSIIRPKVAYGWNFYPIEGGFFTVTCMGGFNIRLSELISLSLECDVEFGMPIFLGRYFSHSFLGGLHFRF